MREIYYVKDALNLLFSELLKSLLFEDFFSVFRHVPLPITGILPHSSLCFWQTIFVFINYETRSNVFIMPLILKISYTNLILCSYLHLHALLLRLGEYLVHQQVDEIHMILSDLALCAATAP